MRKVKRWRFYCDFCRKGGCSGGHISKHERGCTRNPSRVCGMCAAAKQEQRPTSELLAALIGARPDGQSVPDSYGSINAVLEIAGGCPACAMAAIHAYRATNPLFLDPHEGAEDYIEFDYKKAADRFWADVNSREF